MVNLKTPVFYNVALLRPTEPKHSVQVHVQLKTGPGSVHRPASLLRGFILSGDQFLTALGHFDKVRLLFTLRESHKL